MSAVDDLTHLVDARLAATNAQRQLVGHVIDLDPPAVALPTGQIYPAARLAGLQLAEGDRVLLSRAGHGYVILGQLEAIDVASGPAPHEHDALYAPIEHDTAHDDRFSLLGHTHATPAGIAVFTRASGDQSIANDTEVTWFCGNEAEDSIGVSQVTSGVVQCPAGLYLIVAQIGWAGNATGWRRAWIQRNSTGQIVDTVEPEANIQVQNRLVLPLTLANDDTIHVTVRHTAGANLDVRGDGAGAFTSELRIVRLGG